MTGFLMIILAAAGLVVAFEIGRLVHVHEEAGRCVSCAGTIAGMATNKPTSATRVTTAAKSAQIFARDIACS